MGGQCSVIDSDIVHNARELVAANTVIPISSNS